MHQLQPDESTAKEIILRASNLQKTYATAERAIPVLSGLTLQVRPGEFVAVMGPSGSGKTTLLSLLGALDVPDRGEIWLEGVPVHRLRGAAAADFRRQKVGFVFQLFYLLPTLTALENVMGNLDLESGAQVLALLCELQRSGEQTLVLATHDPAIAAQADRIVRLGPQRESGQDR